MAWLVIVAVCILVAVGAFISWRRWVAPWRRIDELVRQIARNERPSTFLVDGGAQAQRLGLVLETIFQRQQQLDQQIAGRESGTQTILGAMHDAVLVVDVHRYIVLMNRAFAKLFQLRDGAVGAPLPEIVRHATLDRLIAETLRSGEAMRSELTLTDSHTNTERRVEASAVPIKEPTDGTAGAVVLFHDITELKRLDQIRSDFVANVSHELRTPLSILRGYIETLLDNPETSRQELSRILNVMERHSERLGLLVDDLLSLAQLESSNASVDLSEVPVRELFENVVHDWKEKLMAKNIKVIVEVPPDLQTIEVDETRLQEVFHNLLENAVKYSPENGEIHLRAARRGNEVVLSVCDQGIGIDKDHLPRIFERFYRADKARSRELGGTGLGLAIVKHIAQLHGGRVEAESERGRGTTIRVVLPAAD